VEARWRSNVHASGRTAVAECSSKASQPVAATPALTEVRLTEALSLRPSRPAGSGERRQSTVSFVFFLRTATGDRRPPKASPMTEIHKAGEPGGPHVVGPSKT
jgi:hypothetical protein